MVSIIQDMSMEEADAILEEAQANSLEIQGINKGVYDELMKDSFTKVFKFQVATSLANEAQVLFNEYISKNYDPAKYLSKVDANVEDKGRYVEFTIRVLFCPVTITVEDYVDESESNRDSKEDTESGS